jgi:DnaK suppressor protein
MTKGTVDRVDQSGTSDIRSALENLLAQVRIATRATAVVLQEAGREANSVCEVETNEVADLDIATQRLTLNTHAAVAIQRALARLEDGTYGLCEECGNLIASPRLMALPFATRCLGCQQSYESEHLRSNSEGVPRRMRL